jgi:anti-sigma B factor antagonist
MSCHASVRHVDGVAIIDLSGRITLGEGSGIVRNTIKDLVDAGERQILVNLREVSYIDSAGLGELVGAYTTVRNKGGDVKLMNTQSKVDSLLAITKLYTVFINYDDEKAAVASFQTP